MNFPLFIARRLFSDHQNKHNVSRPAVTIATAGVTIGLAVMLVSVMVVLGFKHTIRDKVIGFGSHIQVVNFASLSSSGTYPVCIGDSMLHVIKGIPGVKHVERVAYKQGILKTDSDFLGVSFKGVGPDYDTTFIHQYLIEGSIPHFSDTQSGNHILISQSIAKKLGLKCGQRVFAYFIDPSGVRIRRFTISGIYQTNLSQYDDIVCFTDLYTAQKLNGWRPDQVTSAEVTVNNFNQVDEVEQRFVARINRTTDHDGEIIGTQTIRELNPQIFQWLGLLDMNVWIILALMTAVAGITMISGLLIIILERTQMIGILKALGARSSLIRRSFLWLSAFILGRGMLWGNAIALVVCFVQNRFGIVHLDPATYYVSTVPVELNLPYWLILNLATMAVTMLVLILPSLLIAAIHPARSMRYE